MNAIQFITKDGSREYAVIPIDVYEDLLEKAESYEDEVALQLALDNPEEFIPADIVYRLLDGENKVKVWREYRQLTQTKLAELAGLSQGVIAQIESGKPGGNVDTYKKLAVALSLDVDDLI